MLPSLTGIGRYAREIALGLQRSAQVDAEFMYGIRWNCTVPSAAMPGANRLFPLLRDFVPNAYAPRRWVQAASLALHQARRGFDLYHEPAVVALPYAGPKVVTVHDISWIRFPETQPVRRVQALARYVEPGLRSASVVLTPSEFVRREVIDTFRLAPAIVRVTPLAADPDYRPYSPEETRAVMQRFDLRHGTYLLAVGTLEPRKNLATALDAFVQLPAAVRQRHPLVVVGMPGWGATALQRRLEPLIRSGEVRQLGYLRHSELVIVTAGARTLLFPSIYEGFGLPPLEAMACGVPPITSNVASMPEVVGSAGLQVAPHDAAGLASAIKRLIEDDAEHERLSMLGLCRARDFSWHRCVEQTLDAYKAALSAT